MSNVSRLSRYQEDHRCKPVPCLPAGRDELVFWYGMFTPPGHWQLPRRSVRGAPFLLIVFSIIVRLIFSTPVQAAEFTSNYDVRYVVSEDRNTKVTTTIALTNKITNLFAAEYNVTFKGASIENVVGSDNKGPLQIDVIKKGEETTVKAKFNDQVVGKGKTLTFTLSYQSKDIAKKVGRIWEVTLPNAIIGEDVLDYKTRLTVPQDFGEPLYLKPQPVKKENGSFSWSYEQVKNNIITAAFGSSQVFSLKLNYHLNNPSSSSKVLQIALPPDTIYQKVVYESIVPRPEKADVDADGNWLASYKLEPKARMDIKANGYVEVFIKPRLSFPQPKKDPQDTYLAATEFWQVNDEAILKKAKELNTAKRIYQYVVSSLSYDYTRVTNKTSRLGAAKTLVNPNKAICMEFTDLTVTLLRASGIPAREINGYAYTQNPELRPLSLIADVLHAWPEYYDKGKKLWIPIDPTWGNTTGGVDYFSQFDVNHIVFAIHGTSSSYPLPAGSYKLITGGQIENSKDIDIKFADKLPQVDLLPLKTSLDQKPKFLHREERVKLAIKNPNGQALYNLPVSIEGNEFGVSPSSLSIDVLPPWGETEVEFMIRPFGFNPFIKGGIVVDVSGYRSFYPIKSSVIFPWMILAGIVIIISFLAGAIVFYRVKTNEVTRT